MATDDVDEFLAAAKASLKPSKKPARGGKPAEPETDDVDEFLAQARASLQDPASAAPPPPAAPPKRDDYATSTATTPGEQRRADIGKEKEKLKAGIFADSVTAAGYGAARGATLGAVDRLVSIGTQAGESLAAANSGLQENPNAGAEARQSYLQDEARSRSGNEIAHFAGELAGGLVPTIATAGAGAAGRVAPGLLGKAAQVATAPTTRMAATNAVAGAMNQPSDVPADIVRSGATGALIGQGMGAMANKTIGKIIGGSVEREGKGLIRDIMQSESGASATPTARKQLVQKLASATRELRGDPELARAIRTDPESAQRLVQAKLDRVTDPREAMYSDLDARAPKVTLSDLSAGVHKSVKSARDPKERQVLERFEEELQTFWIPKWQQEGMLTRQVGKPMGVNSLAVREWVTQAQNAAADAMGTIDPTRAKKLQGAMADTASEIWQRHLDSSRSLAPDTVAAIRSHDSRVSALLSIDKVLGQRIAKENEHRLGIGKRLEQFSMYGELGLAGAATALGHPEKALMGVAAAETAKAVAKRVPGAMRMVNDNWIAPIEAAARRGVPWAEVTKFAAENGIPQGLARTAYSRGESATGTEPKQ